MQDGLRLRIGVHSGDIVVQGEDLMGDGVNIAARLEPLAETGGIVISARVQEDLAGKLTVTAEDMGEQMLDAMEEESVNASERLAAQKAAVHDAHV